MKKITLLAAMIIACAFANAQTPKVSTQWESTFNKNLQKKSVYNDYLGEDAQSYFLLTAQVGQNPLYIVYGAEKYDKKTLKPTSSNVFNEIGAIKKTYKVGNEAYACVTENPPQYFKVTKDPICGFYKFNKDKMTFESITQQFSGVNFKNLEDLYVSPDNSKVLFVFLEESKKKNEDDSYQFLLTDNQMNKIWEKTVKTSVITTFAVANDGTAYAAIKNKKDKNNFEYTILKASSDSEKRFTVNMNNYMYQEIELLTNNNNKLLAIGFYTDNANEEKTGSYYFAMNANFDKAENVSYQEIPVKWLNLHHKKKKLSERYEDYEFGVPLYGENGEIVVCVEENANRISTHTETTYWTGNTAGSPTSTTGGGRVASTSTSSSKRNFYYDLYVFKINGDQLAWTKRVPKYQGNIESGDKTKGAPQLGDILSYQAFLSGDNVVVVFADNIKKNMQNNENSENVTMTYGTSQMDGNLVSVTLDKDGKQKKEVVNTSALTKDKLDPEMTKCFHITNNQAIVSARKKTDCKMGIITVTP